MSELISIIIPIYNVENFLDQCVNSVLAQTYDNIEIILVDDGSVDNSSAHCDYFAALDPRVHVIHKKNGGLSDARNAGLDIARGDYIGFVDSDDWIEPNMYERLLSTMHSGESDKPIDIVVCNYAFERQKDFKNPGLISEPARCVDRETVLPKKDAMNLLLEDNILQNYVWNKLYRSSLWNDVRFPVGQAFEDINTTWKTFHKARYVVLLPWVGYHYRLRENSIVHSNNIKSEIDCFNAGFARYEALHDEYSSSASAMAINIMHSATTLWGIAWDNRDLISSNKTYSNAMQVCANFSRNHLKLFMNNQSGLGITGRLTLRLLPYANRRAYFAAHLLRQLYLKKHPSY